MEINRLRSIIRESISNNLKEIEDVAENAAMEAKLQAYTEAIEKVNNKINTAESLEEMQELVDPAKLNELKKHLKLLEKSKEKLEKVKAKKNKGKEVVTDEPVEEGNPDFYNDEMKLNIDNKDKDDDDFYEKEMKLNVDEVDLSDEEKEELRKKAEQNPSQALPERTLNEAFLKMQKLAGVITEAQYNLKKSLIENQLNEALNKDIRQFGTDLEKRLKQAGFNTIITFHPSAPTEEMKTKVQEDPKLVILYVNLDQRYQSLQLRGNAKSAKDLEKIVKNYQVAKWNGPKMTFGSGWDTKTKQVVGGFNPGDIVGQDPGIMGPFYDAVFTRYGDTQTRVATTKGNETTRTKGVNQSI